MIPLNYTVHPGKSFAARARRFSYDGGATPGQAADELAPVCASDPTAGHDFTSVGQTRLCGVRMTRKCVATSALLLLLLAVAVLVALLATGSPGSAAADGLPGPRRARTSVLDEAAATATHATAPTIDIHVATTAALPTCDRPCSWQPRVSRLFFCVQNY